MVQDMTDDVAETKQELEKFLNGEPCNQQAIMRFKKHMTDLVIQNHFESYHDYDQLRSLTNEKFAEILDEGDVDLDSTWTSYFYTGFQQKIWNYFNKKDHEEYPVTEHDDDEHGQKQDGVVHKEVSIEDVEQEIQQELDNSYSGNRDGQKSLLDDHLSGLKLFEEFYTEGR
jgi:hypothetical protein